MKTIAVIGGGISGIATSLKLCKESFKVILFEKQNSLGGVSSSLKINNYALDFGPHILSMPNNSKSFLEINELMNEEIILLSDIDKFSKAFYQNKIWDSFPNLSTIISNSGKSFLIKGFGGMFMKKKNKLEQKTSIDYIINTYGKFLYDQWVKPFIFNRFTNQNPPLEIIEKLFPERSLKSILSNRINPANKKDVEQIDEDTHFYFKYGMGSFIEKIKTEIEKHGGIIKTNCEIESISHGDIKEIDYIQNDERTKINVDAIVYTIPIPSCLRWFDSIKLDKKIQKSKNFHCIMVFLMFDSVQKEKFWIINIFDPKKIFFRISQQNFLSKDTIPPNKSALCVEIRCAEKEPIWNKTDEEIFCQVESDLRTMDIFNLDEVEGYKILKINNVYPLEGYEENHENIKNFINSNKNEYAIGNIEGDTGRLTDLAEKNTNSSSGGINLAFFNADNFIKKINDGL